MGIPSTSFGKSIPWGANMIMGQRLLLKPFASLLLNRPNLSVAIFKRLSESDARLGIVAFNKMGCNRGLHKSLRSRRSCPLPVARNL